MAALDRWSFSNESPRAMKNLWIAVVMVLAIILLSIRPNELGDTRVYANDIVSNLGKAPFSPGSSLWEPGHLLWRPLGWGLVSLFNPVFSALTNWTPFMEATFVLTAVSVVCAFITVVLWYWILRRLTGSQAVALGLAIAAACSHGILLRIPSGSAYLPGSLCLTLSLYFLATGRTIRGAIFYGIASCLWMPFILTGPALLLLALLPSGNWSTPLKQIYAGMDWPAAIRFVAGSACVVLLLFGFALLARGTTSLAGAVHWYVAGSHGLTTNRSLMRMATGAPRSFFHLTKDGVYYKRYLMHDPYARVTLWDIAKASLWKLCFFYLYAASLLYELLRKPRSGRMLLIVISGVTPVVLFALLVFEPGSPERYMPALPFLILATAWALRDFPARRRVTQMVIVAFLASMTVSNIYSFAAPRIHAENDESLARVAELRPHLNSAGFIMLATNQDMLEWVLGRVAFNPINRPTPIRIYDIVELGNARLITWRHDLAAQTLKAWQNGGEVWVTKRVWNPRPLPDWDWVEGDDPRITWKELPQFFATVHTDAQTGGPDGFLRLARDEYNQALFTNLAAGNPVPGTS